ncbi:MAG TPA: TIGR03620 family F420-dependent LLM class oxidoreductase [Jatrophihabitantaceae bacterium]|jgi:probable F420-dependent oxidoreductase
MVTRRLIRSATTGIAIDIHADGSHRDTAAELERLGYHTLWVPGGQLDRLDRVSELLAATDSIQVATGIVALGVHAPAEVAAIYAELTERYPGRFVLGVGGPQQRRSLAALGDQLTELDAHGVPAHDRLLAALGPRKVAIARRRTAGAIVLLVTPEFTAQVRSELGEGSILVADQFVVVDIVADRARAAVREPLAFLATVAGYRAAFRRMGFTDADADQASDRLVDAVSVWGDVDDIAARVTAHRAAGADQVVLSVLSTDGGPKPLHAAELLANRLGLAA